MPWRGGECRECVEALFAVWGGDFLLGCLCGDDEMGLAREWDCSVSVWVERCMGGRGRGDNGLEVYMERDG